MRHETQRRAKAPKHDSQLRKFCLICPQDYVVRVYGVAEPPGAQNPAITDDCEARKKTATGGWFQVPVGESSRRAGECWQS